MDDDVFMSLVWRENSSAVCSVLVQMGIWCWCGCIALGM